MSFTFGKPSGISDRVGRRLRRGSSGLVGGRSEAARQVRLDQARTNDRSGNAGGPGAPGTPGAEGLSRGMKYWETSNGAGTFTPEAFGFSIDLQQTGVGPDLATTDLDAFPKQSTRTDNGGLFSNYDAGGFIMQLGDGAGRGGFHFVIQFGAILYPANSFWLVGVSDGSPGFTDLPSAYVNVIGVGQDRADTQPFLFYNNASGAPTRVATGFASIVPGRLYELELFADPFGTGCDFTFRAFSGGLLAGQFTHHASSNLPAVLLSPYIGPGSPANLVETSIARVSVFIELQPWPS